MSNVDENPKEGKWNNEAHASLSTALAEALIASGSSPAQKKDLIMAVMKACGHEGFTWESIRNHRKMPRWDEQTHIDLIIALYTALQPTMTKETQDFLVEAMRSKGHEDVRWDALRVCIALALLSTFHKSLLDINESPRIAIKMPKWEEIRDDLFQAYMNATGPITPEMQASIEEFMCRRATMSSQRYAQRNLTRWDQKTHEDIMLAMFEHFRPTAADMKEIVGLLQIKGHAFTDGALLPAFCSRFAKESAYAQPFKMEEEDVFYKASRPTTWDHDAHLTLLQAVMIEALPSKSQWDKILKRVTRKGYFYTQTAVL
ncbi:hypothetical protein N0V85_003694 [Neurospora sp. IMI 360204]|nr:hypothetical protein N0V85_003694 [Neurospora sp. IMI 360204]